MSDNQQIADDILRRFGIDPKEGWELAEAIKCALTDVEFRAMFGSDNPVIQSTEKSH